jgi:hypothetical protein
MSYDKYQSRHECAVDGCGELISRQLLMCAPHWRQVPKPLQNRVYNTWRGGGAAEYLAAREAAIDSVEGGQS